MSCIVEDGMAICGNFAEVLPAKPKDMDYDRSYKWIEPYSFEWRETLGTAVCSCKTVKVYYAPYYGYDYYHNENCNLLRKLEAEPQIHNLYETYLPAINHYNDAVPNSDHIPLYIKVLSRTSKVKVRHSPIKNINQGVLL